MDTETGRQRAVLSVMPKHIPLNAVLGFADAFLEGLGFDEEECRNVRLALEEVIAFMEATIFSEGDAEPLEIRFDPSPAEIRICLTARGLPLDDRDLPSYSLDRLDTNEEWLGLNLHLAKHAMDRITVTNQGVCGFVVDMVRFRRSAHVMHAMASRPAAPTPRAAAHSSVYTIRPARADEALAISRCAFLTYGYSYEEYIYYPESIVEMNRSGALYSLVAAADDGHVMGHCALKFGDRQRDVAELGVLFVRPEYRRYGIGAALWAAAVATAHSMALKSLFARSVTAHRASQELARRHGFSDCALSLALFPRNVDLKNMGGLQRGKMSGMRQWVCLNNARPEVTTIHPPERYAEIVAELYRRAGIAVSEGAMVCDDRAVPGQVVFQVQRVPALNVAMIEVASHGFRISDVKKRIRRALRQLCSEKLDTVYLTLNLQQAGAGELAEDAAAQGFVFSGIVPDVFPDGDGLALQYLNLPENPLEDLTAWTATAEMLHGFIRQEWESLQ
jgi:N-acetylglutamate synthase-like GNAT family acetyltransferase/anti-sigma regulatory factor (Ser/Thr protein kinase)